MNIANIGLIQAAAMTAGTGNPETNSDPVSTGRPGIISISMYLKHMCPINTKDSCHGLQVQRVLLRILFSVDVRMTFYPRVEQLIEESTIQMVSKNLNPPLACHS